MLNFSLIVCIITMDPAGLCWHDRSKMTKGYPRYVSQFVNLSLSTCCVLKLPTPSRHLQARPQVTQGSAIHFFRHKFFFNQMFDAFEQILPSGAPRMPLWTAWSHVGDLLCTGFGKVLVIDAEDRMAGYPAVRCQRPRPYGIPSDTGNISIPVPPMVVW